MSVNTYGQQSNFFVLALAPFAVLVVLFCLYQTYLASHAEGYPEPCQKSKTDLYAKVKLFSQKKLKMFDEDLNMPLIIFTSF